MFDLSSQKRVKQLRLGLFDSDYVLDKQQRNQQEQVRIPCCVVQCEKEGKADESPTDEQAMVDESIFLA